MAIRQRGGVRGNDHIRAAAQQRKALIGGANWRYFRARQFSARYVGAAKYMRRASGSIWLFCVSEKIIVAACAVRAMR